MNTTHLNLERWMMVLLLAVLPATLAGASPMAGAADPPSAALLACAQLGDDSERLVCYDRVTAQLHADPSHPPAPVSAAAPDMFGSKPPEPGHATPATPVRRTELKSITAHVTLLRENKLSGTVLDLDNGQRWQQLGHEDLMLKVGDSVTISRGAFSSFWIMSPGNRLSHVKRVL